MALPNIATKTGDSGTTALWSGERVPKTDPRIRCVGQIDLAMSFLGQGHRILHVGDAFMQELSEGYLWLQRRAIDLMGEVCTSEEKKANFADKRAPITEEDVAQLEALYDKLRSELDKRGKGFGEWKVYGEKGAAAADFYLIRAQVRQAELNLWSLRDEGFTIREPMLKLLNRLSDLLFYTAVLLEED
ncbi:MAG: ATP:cob(I)alamin adenosyltransferase [Verrucomicrobiota bacterium]